MILPGFSSAAPATPAPTKTGPSDAEKAKAAEEIASRNQGSNRRAEFTKKLRSGLLLKDEAATLG